MISSVCTAMLCLAALVAAQDIVELHPSPTGNWLHGIDCRGANCIAVGEAGSIVTSGDHGLTWTYRPHAANRTDTLPCVIFPSAANPLNAWALRPGHVLYTADAGESWGEWAVPELDATELLGVHTTGDGNVIIVGSDGLIVKLTENAAAAPTAERIVSGTTNWLHDVFMLSDSAYYVVGEFGTVQWTTDNGTTWHTPSGGVPPGAWLLSVWFADTNTGWIGGDVGLILRTDDGGDTWVTQTTNVFSDIHGIAFAGKDTGWAAGTEFLGYPGSVLRTTDGGATWTEMAATVGNGFLAMHLLNRDTGVAVGTGGTIYRTDDRGASWVPLVDNNDADLFGLCFVDTLHGWAVGARGKILRTTDGGRAWTASAAPEAFLIDDITFVDGQRGWAAGRGGNIIATVNGGGGWTEQSSTVTANLHGIRFVDSAHGWAVGDEGTIVHTGDGGDSWNRQASGFDRELYAVDFCDTATGWAVGFGGTVLHTIDGGTTWNEATTTPATQNLFGVECVSSDTAWISGAGMIMVTTDGGASWTAGNGIGSLVCTDVTALGARAWASTTGGFIYHTDNGGTDWTVLDGPSWNALHSIQRIGERHLWAAGNFGTIVFMQPDAATDVRRAVRGQSNAPSPAHAAARCRAVGGTIRIECRDFTTAVLLEANGRVVGTCALSPHMTTAWVPPGRLSGFYVLKLTRRDGSGVANPLVVPR